MKRQKPNSQQTLFDSDAPAWNTLAEQAQTPLLQVVSQLLLEALPLRQAQQRQAQQPDHDSGNTPNIEDSHVA